jgi:hypothetical protein
MSEVEEKKKIQRPRIDDREFTAAWMKMVKAGGNQKDVAEILGCTLGGVGSKLKKLKKDGVPFPDLPSGPGHRAKTTDVAGLTRMIKEMS